MKIASVADVKANFSAYIKASELRQKVLNRLHVITPSHFSQAFRYTVPPTAYRSVRKKVTEDDEINGYADNSLQP